ncbi:MAG: TVP38/TMEM64 family protein [Magnetovibrionaceae bacterium]
MTTDSASTQTGTMDSAPNGEPARKAAGIGKFLPLIVLALGAGLFFGLGLHQYLSFEALRDHRETLMVWVDNHGIVFGLGYILAYALAVVFLPPSGTIMTLAAGFIFGWAWGGLIAVIGATLGATALFEACRHSLGDVFRKRAGGAIRRMEAGFKENALSYMLVLRLVPLFPFWLVNIAPAFLGVNLRTYVIGTLLGIIPGTIVYTIFGAGLGSIFDSGEELTLSGIVTPEILAGLVGLGLLALVPVVYRKMKKPKTKDDQGEKAGQV